MCIHMKIKLLFKDYVAKEDSKNVSVKNLHLFYFKKNLSLASFVIKGFLLN